MTGRAPWTAAEQRFLAAFADHGDIILSVTEEGTHWAPTDAAFEDPTRSAFGPVLKVLIDVRDDAAVHRFVAEWAALTASGGALSDMRFLIYLTDPDAVPASNEPPRGATSSGTQGTPPPHVQDAPRGPHRYADHRPADPEWWDAERDASLARATMLGGALLIVTAAVVLGAIAALVWTVTR